MSLGWWLGHFLWHACMHLDIGILGVSNIPSRVYWFCWVYVLAFFFGTGGKVFYSAHAEPRSPKPYVHLYCCTYFTEFITPHPLHSVLWG